jgi:hypothetical protein
MVYIFGYIIIEGVNYMKKIFLIILIFTFAMSASAQINVTAVAPTFSGSSPLISSINTEFQTIFSNLAGTLETEFGFISPNPQKLIQAFANSAVYASHGATQRGYAGYGLFAVTVGATVGLQLPVGLSEVRTYFPELVMDLITDISSIKTRIQREGGDITLGASPQLLNAQITFNASKLINHLYIGIRAGYMKISDGQLADGLVFNNLMLGATLNYQVLPKLSLAGLITWRGLNIGTGFIFQKSNLGFSFAVDPVTGNTGSGAGNIGYRIDPRIGFDVDVTTYTIPLEATTALKILIFNIPVGIGVDFAFGKSNVSYSVDAEVNFKGLPTGVTQSSPGRLSATGGGSMSPTVANFKIMTGIGLVFGPVIIDIPVTWYFKDNGYTIGLTVGVAL